MKTVLQLDELLDRPPLRPGLGREAIAGKVVLVTGAGGSIGSTLARSIAEAEPASLILLDSSEHDLHGLQVALGREGGARRIFFLLADVAEAGPLKEAFGRFLPDVVLHAAAYKQVPLLETQPLAALRNNVLGTRLLLETAQRSETPRLVMISTDKAVSPRSWLGATKRLAELILLAGPEGPLEATSVRLGNVWGSRGSVLPYLADQLEARRPLILTHPEASRYFMTSDEAAAVVLAAACLGRGRDILVPDLGKPIPILDIARRLIDGKEHSGVEDAIRYVGLRPGEKLHEEPFRPSERVEPTSEPHLSRVVGPLPDPEEVRRGIDELEALLERGDVAGLFRCVRRLVSDYRPSETLLAHVEGAASFKR